MTGNEIARAVRGYRGRVYLPVAMKNDVVHMPGVKQDVVDLFKGYGDAECGMSFDIKDNGVYIDIDYSMEGREL